MKHKANLMKMNISKLNMVWYVDFAVSNHMLNHEEWFSYLKKPEQLGVVETGDDTPQCWQPSWHVIAAPLIV